METPKHEGIEGPRGHGNVASSNGRTSALIAALRLKPGRVLVRKVRGPDGPNALLGMRTIVGDVYSCSAADAHELTRHAGSEFETVEEFAADVAAAAIEFEKAQERPSK